MSEPVAAGGKGMKLHTKILVGLAIGAVLGITANVMLGADNPTVEWINKYLAGPIGQIFLRMLFMIVMPLVFASIALGVAGLGDIRHVGRVGAKTMAYFLITTILSATLGLVLVNIVRPGSRLDATVRAELLATYAGDAASKVEAAQTGSFGIETLVNFVTRNPIKSAVDMDMMGVIFFGLMFGAALTMITAARAKPMMDVLQALQDVVIKIVEIAMRIAPYGVAGLIFGVTSRFGYSLLLPLGSFVAVVIVGLLIHSLVTLALIVKFGAGLSPVLFYSRVRSSIVTAFSTSSSAATLPTNLAVAEQNLGIPRHIAGFTGRDFEDLQPAAAEALGEPAHRQPLAPGQRDGALPPALALVRLRDLRQRPVRVEARGVHAERDGEGGDGAGLVHQAVEPGAVLVRSTATVPCVAATVTVLLPVHP